MLYVPGSHKAIRADSAANFRTAVPIRQLADAGLRLRRSLILPTGLRPKVWKSIHLQYFRLCELNNTVTIAYCQLPNPYFLPFSIFAPNITRP